MKRAVFCLIIVILLIQDIARWCIWIYMSDEAPIADAAQYLELGRSVAEGEYLLRPHPIAYRTPGYPWFIGIVISLFPQHPILAIQFAQGMLLTLTSVAIAIWCRVLTGDVRWALMAWGLSLLSLSRSTFITVVLSETLFTFMLTVHLLTVTGLAKCYQQRRSRIVWWTMSLAAGTTLGGLILVRPIALYLPLAHAVPIVLLAIKILFARPETTEAKYSTRRGRNGLAIESIVISFAVAYLMLTPWTQRNQSMFGESFVTEFVGRNIWIVTFQEGAGADLPIPETEQAQQLMRTTRLAADSEAITHTWTVSDSLVQAGLKDHEADRLMRGVAWDAIQQHPEEWLVAAARRFVNYWRCVADELPTLKDSWLSSKLWWCQLIAAVTMVAGCLALVSRHTFVEAIWLFALLGYFGSITALVEIPDYRYRLVVEPLMITLFVMGMRSVHRLVPREAIPDNANGTVHVV